MFPFRVPKSIEYLEWQTVRDYTVALQDSFDAEPIEIDVMYFNHIMLYVRFTADAATNLIMRPEYSHDGTNWYRQSIYDPAAVAAGADTTSLVQRELLSYGNVDGDDFFIFGIAIEAGVQYFRLPCRHDDDQAEHDCGIYAAPSYK